MRQKKSECCAPSSKKNREGRTNYEERQYRRKEREDD
jgi:hypothetical protein